MQSYKTHSARNFSIALLKSRLLPVATNGNKNALTCSNCAFVNPTDYNYCTNCGYPVHKLLHQVELYYSRLRQRRSVQQRCFLKIAHARNALYLLAGFSMLGIFYLFSEWKAHVLKGMLMVLLGVIYAGLGRWSVQKPFTALLISLMLLLTFAAINTWTEITGRSTSTAGIGLLIIQVVLIYFLLQGVKGAFRADILEEEFKL